MKHLRILLTGISLAFALAACNSGKERLAIDLSGINIDEVKVHRYDLDLFYSGKGDLQAHLASMQKTYPFFLATNLNDPQKLKDMQEYLDNPRNIEFHQAVAKMYPDMNDIGEQLTLAFRHLRYYFPAFNPPRVYSYISGGDYDAPVQYVDSVLLIGPDNFLGSGFNPYIADGLPQYRVNRMSREFIVPVSVRVILESLVPQDMSGNTLLDQLVDAGKRLYLLDAMIPGLPDRLKIGYTEQQYNWITRNEKHVWAAMITHRMIYSSDAKIFRTFLADGPFTADFSKESPPRLGEWIGWQIVSGYMSHNPKVTLQMLIGEKDAQKILSESEYKPEL